MKPILYMRGENGASGQFSTIGLIDMINSISNTKEMTMIEIGSYIGESTILFAKNFKKVISIDPHFNYDEIDSNKYAHFNIIQNEYFKNISKFDNIQYIRKTSDDAINDIIEKVDFVYIDGLHTYEQTKQDIINYKKVIKNNGIIGGHDYNYLQSVTQAVNDVLGVPEYTFRDYSWYKKL